MSAKPSWYEVIRQETDLAEFRKILGIDGESDILSIRDSYKQCLKYLREKAKGAKEVSERDQAFEELHQVDIAYDVLADCLEQGDILFGCPIPQMIGLDLLTVKQLREFKSTQRKKPKFSVVIEDVIILSQSCDLRNDKIHDIVVAQVQNWKQASIAEYKVGNTVVLGSKFRKAIADGNVPSLCLLNKHTSEPSLDWSVVNFSKLYVLPKNLLALVAECCRPRLRLLAPYREHLAQSFARYFM